VPRGYARSLSAARRGANARWCDRMVSELGRADRDPLTERVIGLAMEVHRALGPGLLESAYEECLAFEFREHGVAFSRQVPLSVRYKSVRLDCGYRMDLVIEDRVVVELKTVERLLPVHEAQLLTYLKLSGLRVGLLMNFNVAVLKDGINRLVL
jgi:GxxExxY protein